MTVVFAEVLKDLGLFSKCSALSIGLISFTAYRNYYKE